MTDGARRPGPVDPRRSAVTGRRADESDGYRQDSDGRAPYPRDGYYREEPEARRPPGGRGAGREDIADQSGGTRPGYEGGRTRAGGEQRGNTGRGGDRDGSGNRRREEPTGRGTGPARDYRSDDDGPPRRGGYQATGARPATGGRPATGARPAVSPGRQDGWDDRRPAGRTSPENQDPPTDGLPVGTDPSPRAGGGTGRFASAPGPAAGERARADGPGGAGERPWRTGGRGVAPRDGDADEGGFQPGRGTGARRAAAAATSSRFAVSPESSGRFSEVDDAEDSGDGLESGASSSARVSSAKVAPDPGMGLFLRRLVIALVWLGFALGLGVGAGVVWEKVRPSGESAVAAPTSATPTAITSAPAGGTPAPSPSAAATPAVPSDWVSYTTTASKAKSTFSHPGSWAAREDSTGVFFGEPSGPRMVGVARRTGVDGAGALSKVQALEFGGQPGLAVTGSGDVTDPVSGAKVRELTGTYTRQGQKVSYLMRSVDASGAVYVLIVRVPADSDAELDTLMTSLRRSFQPAA
ncbi:hypothetical protein [Pseudofrankia asymbiotica]|uniref:Uncharacterized protein n=1 Tax=Pseudofrankia asymbiotica TaxID=1834516 RepID=A0A1V2I609_9ACTN|nr:hypothetical protein [Pseudofrankia asymbiotica]ONH26805.1 hypothetical protein BL253_24025 [Pseudofrankia asymbiotica]